MKGSKSKMENTKGLMTFIENATSPFHTIMECDEMLSKAGFEKLEIGEKWNLEKGGRYYMVFAATSVFAFTIGKNMEARDAMRFTAGHGDFPGFRIKPNPDTKVDGYLELNMEVYGGVNLSSFMDRPLSAAGRVVLKSGEIFKPDVRYVDIKEPFMIIPSSAIHLTRELLGKTAELNKQTRMEPVWGSEEITGKQLKNFRSYLAEKMGVNADDILEYELNIYNTDKPEFVGANEEFVSAPRLDDISSVYAIMEGMKVSKPERGLHMGIVYDHEEIGSRTKVGAQSNILPLLLEKIYASLGYTKEELISALQDSLMLSADVAQGVHPNYKEKYDPTNRPILNGGFCVKEAQVQSYVTDSIAIGIVEQLCKKHEIRYQKCVNRNDMPSGSTLGSLVQAVLPIKAVDMGIPLLSMHSARELGGVRDIEALVEVMKAFYTE